jgi:hypothetical protein
MLAGIDLRREEAIWPAMWRVYLQNERRRIMDKKESDIREFLDSLTYISAYEISVGDEGYRINIIDQWLQSHPFLIPLNYSKRQLALLAWAVTEAGTQRILFSEEP